MFVTLISLLSYHIAFICGPFIEFVGRVSFCETNAWDIIRFETEQIIKYKIK